MQFNVCSTESQREKADLKRQNLQKILPPYQFSQSPLHLKLKVTFSKKSSVMTLAKLDLSFSHLITFVVNAFTVLAIVLIMYLFVCLLA